MAEEISAFRPVPRTGVIYVTTEATKLGFSASNPDWCNLGQGQPETGELPGAPPRVQHVAIAVDDQEYAPVAGLWELREAIAAALQPRSTAKACRRSTRPRTSASRAAGAPRSRAPRRASGSINLGHFLPDYTAYEELLDIFKAFTEHPDPARGRARLQLHARRSAARNPRPRPLGASHVEPVQPDGQARRRAKSSSAGCAIARELDCTLLLDEFYSHYIYRAPPGALPVESAARYVEGRRQRSGRHLRRLHEELALPRLARHLGGRAEERHRALRERRLVPRRRRLEAAPARRDSALRARTTSRKRRWRSTNAFREKRDRMLSRLERIGVRFDRVPDGTFYAWGNVAQLPAAAQRRHGLLPRGARRRRSSCVPGEFFDVNPGKRRSGRASRFRDYVRFSFGPSKGTLEKALERFEELVR